MGTYKNESMDKLLDRWDNKKKDKHGKHRHKQQGKIFDLSVDVMLGNEALVILTTLSWIIA